MNSSTDRRGAMQALGVTLAAGMSGLAASRAHAVTSAGRRTLPEGAATLADFTRRLDVAPRRRRFSAVPMILNHPDQWDHEALSEVLAYKPVAKQAWDNTDIGGSWLNAMRNALNAQVWSFGDPNFLVVSATHGSAHLALLDQAMWDKYGLARFAGKDFPTNTLIVEHAAANADPQEYEDPRGVFSPENNSILALQKRGVVFLSCHNAIWELAAKLAAGGANPDKLSTDALAAELTNHLVAGVVLTPGVVATLPELQRAGFAYAR